MKYIKISVPILGTGALTAGCVYLAIWLTGLVPDGEWASLIKAMLVVGVIIGALVTIAWSAYFSLIVRRLMRSQEPEKNGIE